MKKNLLIISYGYPPLNDAGAQRPYAVAKYLDKEKFKVSVITCENPSSVSGINKNFNSFLDNVSLIKIKSYVGDSANTFNPQQPQKKSIKLSIKKMIFNVGQQLMFPDKGMFWYPNVKKYLKQNKDLIKNTDVVFSTSPGVTNHRIARLIKKQNQKIKWIADFRDFNYVEHWEAQKTIKAILHKRLEAAIINDATKVTLVTSTMQKAYQTFYQKHQEKIHCVYNGFDINDFPTINASYNDSWKMSFFYAGSFYAGLRSPKPLLQLLDKAFEEQLLNKEQVQIKIAGNLDEETKSGLKAFNSYACIHFLGSVPRTEVLKYMCNSTFLWLIVGNIKSHYQTVPIKLFEYIAARRPILNFAPIKSESSQIINDNNLGFNFNTLDFNLEESFIIFKDLISKYKKGAYQSPIPEENLNAFTWENRISQLEKII